MNKQEQQEADIASLTISKINMTQLTFSSTFYMTTGILIGQKGSGKTEFVKYISNRSENQKSIIDQMSDKKEMTSSDHKFEDDNYTLNIIDPAMDMNSLTNNYFKLIGKTLLFVIFVFDLTNIESFEQIQKYYDSDKNDIKDMKLIKFLLGTKKDLKQQIDDQDIIKYASVNGMKYLKVDSTQQNDQKLIQQFFQHLNNPQQNINEQQIEPAIESIDLNSEQKQQNMNKSQIKPVRESIDLSSSKLKKSKKRCC